MGIHGSRYSSSQKEAEAQLGSWELREFREFMSRHYNGDFDDFSWTMIQAFRKWQDLNKKPPSTDPKFSRSPHDVVRTYVEVPYARKDDFKAKFSGRWDGVLKLWWCVPLATDAVFAGFCNQNGLKPIARMDGTKVQKVFDAGLFKKYFGGGHETSMMESAISEL